LRADLTQQRLRSFRKQVLKIAEMHPAPTITFRSRQAGKTAQRHLATSSYRYRTIFFYLWLSSLLSGQRQDVKAHLYLGF